MITRTRSQLCLRPFDVGVAARLLLVPEDRYEPMARALVTSTSAVHRSVVRLMQAGICRAHTRAIAFDSFIDFVRSGVRYAYPPMKGSANTGVSTACSHPDLGHLDPQSHYACVWASGSGTDRGVSLVPLFSGVPEVSKQDPRMHRILAAVDMIRICESKERDAVCTLLQSWVS